MVTPALLLLAFSLSATEFAATPALPQLLQTAQQAAQAATFPSCAPEAGYAWCPTNAEAFARTLAPAQRDAMKAAFRAMLTGDVAGQLREMTAGDALAQRHIAAFVAAVNGPAVDAWRLATSGAGLVAVGFVHAEHDVTIPLTIDKLFPAGMSENLRTRHNGLACDAEFIAFFGRDGSFRRVNPFLGACHDASE